MFGTNYFVWPSVYEGSIIPILLKKLKVKNVHAQVDMQLGFAHKSPWALAKIIISDRFACSKSAQALRFWSGAAHSVISEPAKTALIDLT